MSAQVLSFPPNPRNFAACREGLRITANRLGATPEQYREAIAYGFALMRQGRTAAYALSEAGRILRGGRSAESQTPPPRGAA